MTELLAPALFVLLFWWASTGLVLKLVWLRPQSFGRSMCAAGVLGAVALAGIRLAAESRTDQGAYVSFSCGIVVWGFHELAFLVGALAGPRRTPCVEHASGWARFRDATLVVIHHELALAGTVLLLVAITWHAPNQVGTWTFFALWVMRLSAKLNLFLGVRNVNLDLVPSHLRYMTSYFRQARFNGLMPLSLATLACAAWLLLRIAAQAPSDGFLRTSSTLLATLVGLAALEHVFLAVPLRDAVLWRWATRRAEPATPRALGAP